MQAQAVCELEIELEGICVCAKVQCVLMSFSGFKCARPPIVFCAQAFTLYASWLRLASHIFLRTPGADAVHASA